MLTLADQTTLARLVLAPAAAAAYLLLPIEGSLCFLVAAIVCGLAEITDWLDGRIARARREVSDFGKLADPFCDVIYRLTLFLVLLLPAGGLGYDAQPGFDLLWDPPAYAVADARVGAGLVPFLPVLIMVLRELVAGALRSMAATRGLVLAARVSGKVKAWFQGTTIITALALPVVFGGRHAWHLDVVAGLTWLCAALSTASILEYIWINRDVLRQLVQRRAM